MVRSVLRSLTVVFSFSALLAINPTPSLAIPVAGDHIFTLGFSGTFTTDGNQVTAFDITVPTGDRITTADVVPGHPTTVNDAGMFAPVNTVNSFAVRWNTDLGQYFQPGVGNTIIDIAYATASVPEPPAGLLILIGLVLLAGYGWRHQQAGLQVG